MRRLADAGLAGQQEELAASGRDLVEASVGQLEEVVAPDEERADRPADGLAMASQCRARPSTVIGHSTDDVRAIAPKVELRPKPARTDRQQTWRLPHGDSSSDVHSGFFGVIG